MQKLKELMPDRQVGVLYTDNATSTGRKKINIILFNVKSEGKLAQSVKLFALESKGRIGEYAIYRKDLEHVDLFPKKDQ